MARNQMVVRQWLMLQALQARPYSTQQLARELGVTERTIWRDLDALQEARFPLFNQRRDDGEWRRHLMTGAAAPARRAAGVTIS